MKCRGAGAGPHAALISCRPPVATAAAAPRAAPILAPPTAATATPVLSPEPRSQRRADVGRPTPDVTAARRSGAAACRRGQLPGAPASRLGELGLLGLRRRAVQGARGRLLERQQAAAGCWSWCGSWPGGDAGRMPAASRRLRSCGAEWGAPRSCSKAPYYPSWLPCRCTPRTFPPWPPAT